MPEELDFTRHFSAKYTVPEPVATAEAASDIDKLGLIGVSELKDKGYFTRIVVQNDKPARKLLDPTKIRILVVEDDDGTAMVIEKALHAYGCQTRRARNRLEIAEALAAKPFPHLVLLDVLLPDANGFDVLNRIRQHPLLENLPVMMLTSLGERKDVARGLMLGANGYITKPVPPSTLLEAIETVVGG
ncbi:MAG: response regulator [Candidatus Parcubacteria bacterium]|nr:response regulator [Burkholderiales bacterium]